MSKKCRCKSAGTCKTCPCSKAKTSCTPACGCGDWCLNFPEAVKVRAMSAGAIRKMLAGNGLSPIGEKDELVLRLAKWLKEQNGGDGGVAGSSDSASAKPTTISPTQLIEDVTRLEDDHTALLSLSGVQVTNSSSTSTMRKAYLLLSRQIHPDKHGGSSDAKKAFQCLVIAFDTLSRRIEL